MRGVGRSLLAALAAALMWSGAAFAQQPQLTIALTPPVTAVMPGEEFELAARVEDGSAEVSSYKVAVQWDPSVLELSQLGVDAPTGVTCGDPDTDMSGMVSVVCSAADGVRIEESETLATVSFVATSFGTTIVALNESTLTGADGAVVDIATVNAAVNVSQNPATAVIETPAPAVSVDDDDDGGGVPTWLALTIGAVAAVLAGAAGVYLSRRSR